MSTRRRAREVALQVLFQFDLNPAAVAVDFGPFLRARLRLPPLVTFARALIEGVGEERDRIDALLDLRSEHWRISRMAATDRAVLRLAVYELASLKHPVLSSLTKQLNWLADMVGPGHRRSLRAFSAAA